MKIDNIITDEADKCEEGCVYSSSLGMFGDESNKDVTEIKSIDFNDLNKECSKESKEIAKKDVRYVFIRNIHGVYKNPLAPAATLDKGIRIADGLSKKDHKFYNHSTMSCTLTDGFAGLTMDSSAFQVKEEYVTQPEKVNYTSGCRPDKSEYSIFSVEVTKTEYEEIKKMINNAMSNVNIKYSIITDFLIGIKLISNNIKNFFTSKFRKDNFSSESKHFDENKLVCSTFVAYVLIKCSSSIREYMSKKVFNWDTVTPNRLISNLPNCKKLFSGTWDKYNETAKKYIEKHPEFKKYYK